jgi:1,4-dihydroxy-2-naphthoate octaprenyltransferase
LFAGLGLGALPVVGTALVQTGRYEPAAIAAAIPAFLMTFNLLLLNEFPDEDADREAGRRNLIILLDRRDATVVYLMCVALVPVSLVSSVALGSLPRAALLAALPSLALMPAVRWGLSTPDRPVPHAALRSNVIWNLSTNAVLAIALML